MAEFRQQSGAVFSHEAVESCVASLIPLRSPVILAIDWARFHDYTAVVVVSGNQQRFGVNYLDRVQDKNWDVQIRWILEILEKFPTASLVADVTGVGNAITDQLRRVSKRGIREVTFTSQSKPRIIENLVRTFETQSIEIPPFLPLLEELRNYQASVNAMGHPVLGASSGHDDFVIALALAADALPFGGHRMIATSHPRS